MIDYIKGDLVELAPARMVIECGGIGYEVNISLNTYSAFNGQSSGKGYVYEVIREDAHLLYGFKEREERELFLLLISVSGVGANTARMILSSFSPADLVAVIAEDNEKALTAVKGIGLKTAQRILVDLRNKVKTVGYATSEASVLERGASPADHPVREEAVAALVMLGFVKATSQKVVTKILKDSPGLTVEQVIKAALRML